MFDYALTYRLLNSNARCADPAHACTRACIHAPPAAAAGLDVDVALPSEGEPQAVVEALEGHFGAGKLLW